MMAKHRLPTIFSVNQGRTIVAAMDGCEMCIDALRDFVEERMRKHDDRLIVALYHNRTSWRSALRVSRAGKQRPSISPFFLSIPSFLLFPPSLLPHSFLTPSSLLHFPMPPPQQPSNPPPQQPSNPPPQQPSNPPPQQPSNPPPQQPSNPPPQQPSNPPPQQPSNPPPQQPSNPPPQQPSNPPPQQPSNPPPQQPSNPPPQQPSNPPPQQPSNPPPQQPSNPPPQQPSNPPPHLSSIQQRSPPAALLQHSRLLQMPPSAHRPHLHLPFPSHPTPSLASPFHSPYTPLSSSSPRSPAFLLPCTPDSMKGRIRHGRHRPAAPHSLSLPILSLPHITLPFPFLSLPFPPPDSIKDGEETDGSDREQALKELMTATGGAGGGGAHGPSVSNVSTIGTGTAVIDEATAPVLLKRLKWDGDAKQALSRLVGVSIEKKRDRDAKQALSRLVGVSIEKKVRGGNWGDGKDRGRELVRDYGRECKGERWEAKAWMLSRRCPVSSDRWLYWIPMLVLSPLPPCSSQVRFEVALLDSKSVPSAVVNFCDMISADVLVLATTRGISRHEPAQQNTIQKVLSKIGHVSHTELAHHCSKNAPCAVVIISEHEEEDEEG
ncbi:unnamed protein product [Closterium sp. NIES-64]|nr:unnamed protein product [Closterium sp. NIES-64]